MSASHSEMSESSNGSDSEEMMQGRGRGRGRGRGTRRGRGSVRSASSSRGRGRGRGRGRSRSKDEGSQRLEKSDKERVKEMWNERKEEMKEIVARVDESTLRKLVLDMIEREPGLIFDICEAAGNGGGRPDPVAQPFAVPSWCKCNNCHEMPTDLEKKCCGCLPRNCISARPQMDRIVLDPEVLAIGNRYYREMLGRHGQRIEENNKSKRHAAYRNFTLWRHGRLGAGVRRVIPSCCIWRIRDTYPSSTGQYTGFLPSRYA